MLTLYKYEIPRGLGTIQLPVADSHAIHSILPKVIMQNGVPYLYAAVDTEATETMDIHTLLVGTGQPLPVNYDDFHYIDTVQEGPYVWHVFVLEPTSIAARSDEDQDLLDDLFAEGLSK